MPELAGEYYEGWEEGYKAGAKDIKKLKKEILLYIDTLTDPMQRVAVRHTLRIIDEWSNND